jgi:FimV-like protein
MRKFLIYLVFLFPLVCFAHQPRAIGPIKVCDNLWQISSQIHYAKPVIQQQVMLALVQKNPQAFTKGNVNYLIQGYYLRVPTIKEVLRNSKASAIQQVARQNKAWQNIEVSVAKKHGKQYRKLRKADCAPKKKPSFGKSKKFMHHLSTVNVKLSMDMHRLMQQNKSLKHLALHLMNKERRLHDIIILQHAKIEQLQVAMQQEQQSGVVVTKKKTNQKFYNSLKNTVVTPIADKTQKMVAKSLTLLGCAKMYRDQNQLWYLLIVVVILVLLLVLLCVWIFRSKPAKDKVIPEMIRQEKTVKKSNKYNYISGEDIITTKLDLARAYVDMGDYTNARDILESVAKEGDAGQKSEAKLLLKKTEKK